MSLGAARGPLPPTAAGVLWMLAASSAIALIDAMAKYLSRDLNGVQVAWGYFAAMSACLVAVLACRGASPARVLRSHFPLLQLSRAACMVLSLSCLFFSLRFLPLAEATVISFTAPLFIVALSSPMLGERVGPHRWLAVCAGMCGAIIVVRPGTDALHPAALITLLGALFFALFNIITRRLGSGNPIETTLSYSFGLGTAALSLAMPAVWVPPSPGNWLLMGLSGALGLCAHFAIVRALSLADASSVAPLNYVRLVWAIVIGALVFGDVPDAATLLGGTITMASGLFVLYYAVR